MQRSFDALRTFLSKRMYEHPRVLAAGMEGRRTVLTLCEQLMRAPTDKVLSLQKRTGGTLAEAIKDYVAGMTDAYAKTTVYTPS